MTIVWPRSCRARRRKSSRSAPLRESRLPVGSSANTMAGLLTSARATATRCCCPPDSSDGRCASRSARPTVSMTASYQSGSGLSPASARGRRMFSAADSVGTRLNDWNTKPTRSRRSSVSCLSLSELRSTSPSRICPPVRASRPARQCSSVDLPEPDGPMIAVNCPSGNSAVTSSRATTAVSPLPYVLVACTARAALLVMRAFVMASIVVIRAAQVVHPTSALRLPRPWYGPVTPSRDAPLRPRRRARRWRLGPSGELGDEPASDARREQRLARGHRAQRADQLGGLGVFDQEAGRACAQRLEDVLVELERRQDDHPDVHQPLVRGNGAGGREAVRARHPDVHQHDVGT